MIARFSSVYHRYHHTLRSLVRFAMYCLAFFLIGVAYWVTDNFGEPSLEQVLYHIQFGMEGLVDTDPALIQSFVKTAILTPLLVAFLLVFFERSLGLYLTFGVHHGVSKLFSNANIRVLRLVYWIIGHRAPLYVLIGGSVYFGVQFSILTFLHNQWGPDYFAAHYIYPNTVQIEPVQPRNLIMIYVESMETSYRNPTLFGKNLLAPLDALHGVSFAHYRQAPGTSWTIAGITATQCGLPLQSVSLYDGNGNGENIRAFLPKAVCIGDVLSRFGYHNVYMGGDALAFSGKGKFFQDHHYQETFGQDELKGSRTEKDMNDWGLYDPDMLQYAKIKISELHAKKQHFNFVMTTLDTHGPDGFYSPFCKAHGAKKFPDIVECTAQQVAEFVQWLRKTGITKDTQIVIVGDHLAMENPVYDTLKSIPERYVYNQLISDQAPTKTRDDVLHFDMFPTILAFIGFRIVDGKLGLGFNAIAKDPATPPEHELDDMNTDLLNYSDEYLELWKADTNTSGLTIPEKTSTEK